MLFLLRDVARIRPPHVLRIQRCNLTRYSQRTPGNSRLNRRRPAARSPDERHRETRASPDESMQLEEKSSVKESPLWLETEKRLLSANPEEGLKALLAHETLVVTRQIEMLNIFIGFEQNNKYAITNETDETLGYIVEEIQGVTSIIMRQIFRTHRPFRALIMDPHGTPIMMVRRPFAWINSRMFVQKIKNADTDAASPTVLDTFGEVQQRWHLWRRRYDLFLRSPWLPIRSEIDDAQPEPEPDTSNNAFTQFAHVDGGFWAWNFALRDARGEEIASVNRAFRGFGLEIFTDTGKYFIRFSPSAEPADRDVGLSPLRKISVERGLTLNEKALVLALAVDIDFDYFSRHSGGGGVGHFWFFDD